MNINPISTYQIFLIISPPRIAVSCLSLLPNASKMTEIIGYNPVSLGNPHNKKNVCWSRNRRRRVFYSLNNQHREVERQVLCWRSPTYQKIDKTKKECRHSSEEASLDNSLVAEDAFEPSDVPNVTVPLPPNRGCHCWLTERIDFLLILIWAKKTWQWFPRNVPRQFPRNIPRSPRYYISRPDSIGPFEYNPFRNIPPDECSSKNILRGECVHRNVPRGSHRLLEGVHREPGAVQMSLGRSMSRWVQRYHIMRRVSVCVCLCAGRGVSIRSVLKS